MFDKKSSRGSDEQLDLIGREIIRASAANDDEAQRVAASPFLYTRLRSRINAERGQREERESWLTMLGVVWRAIPAMAIVAVLAVALFLSASSGTGPSENPVYESLLGTSEAGVENVVFADNQTLSSDEVLATILDEDMQEASR